ncbi:hypothetical protein [Hymenobacter sp.]|uniref:hypothetical protein n=1 Tax=Hymenobacter sp. TaxID=1898978 RepID=UPI00286B7131|nr:hypothetical protein [Hymenobacter sp.]
MPAKKLAFLQNFYTDVTLYVPAEAVPPPAPANAPALPARPAPTAPVRPVATLPTRGFSKPSAGLERLASGFVPPVVPAEKTDVAAAPMVVRAAAPIPAALAPAASVPPAREPAAPAVPPVLLTPFSTLGTNDQGVLLLFRLPQDQFLKLHRNVFLNKMLQALGLVMADVVLVNVESELPVALVNLRRTLAGTHIVAFGKNLLDTTIRNTQIYEPVLFPGLGLSYLASATVDLVEYDVSLKKRLWPGLQRMFGQAY